VSTRHANNCTTTHIPSAKHHPAPHAPDVDGSGLHRLEQRPYCAMKHEQWLWGRGNHSCITVADGANNLACVVQHSDSADLLLHTRGMSTRSLVSSPCPFKTTLRPPAQHL